MIKSRENYKNHYLFLYSWKNFLGMRYSSIKFFLGMREFVEEKLKARQSATWKTDPTQKHHRALSETRETLWEWFYRCYQRFGEFLGRNSRINRKKIDRWRIFKENTWLHRIERRRKLDEKKFVSRRMINFDWFLEVNLSIMYYFILDYVSFFYFNCVRRKSSHIM